MKITVKNLRAIIREQSELERRLAALRGGKGTTPSPAAKPKPVVAKPKQAPVPVPEPIAEPAPATGTLTLKQLVRDYAAAKASSMRGQAPDEVAWDAAMQFVSEHPEWVDLPGASKFHPSEMQDHVASAIYDAMTKSDAGAMASEPAAKAARGPKATYKVYGKMKGAPAHTRLKGKAYVAPGDTQFKPGEQARVEPSDGKLKVRKTDSDHEQTWEPE